MVSGAGEVVDSYRALVEDRSVSGFSEASVRVVVDEGISSHQIETFAS